ncbi:MAG: hypothetical protein FWD16_03255 [Clostridia bacterium]|nr:hypothetical protein [Clostridia bacterium]
MRKMECEFKRFEGQPVKIYTDDSRIHRGIVLECDESAVRLIDRCGRIQFISFCHIDSIVEPQMHLGCCRDDELDYIDVVERKPRCKMKDECGNRDDDCDCGKGRCEDED